VMLFDETTNATSAVYSFFDPAESRRSLGTWMILKLVEYTKNSGRDYLYLGYLIRQSRKMAYKERFQPLQILIKNEWIDFQNMNI
jgi:arginyl-tRNA--protein-N-Asp/Glu arginylyltransferase